MYIDYFHCYIPFFEAADSRPTLQIKIKAMLLYQPRTLFRNILSYSLFKFIGLSTHNSAHINNVTQLTKII
jgi:hypothetical protein